jgi:hypothetical protein
LADKQTRDYVGGDYQSLAYAEQDLGQFFAIHGDLLS